MIDLSGRNDVPVAEAVLRELSATCGDIGVEFLVIGAAARDLIIHARQHGQPVRATEDIDIAVAVHAGEQFTQIARRLGQKGRSEHRFVVLGVEVDVIPFGRIEHNRTIHFKDDHRLDVNGLREAHATALSVRLPQGTVVRVASAPAQSVLKILAWRDRHLVNPKDGSDLRVILTAMAEDPFVDEVWENTTALEATDYDIYAAASYHCAQQAAEPFTHTDGSDVVDVLRDVQLRARLERDMRSELASALLDAYALGFATGLKR